MSNEVVPFGKYKGQPLEAMAADRQYVDWLMQQPWFRERHKNLYTVVINNFQEPSETPEHNALQVLFLEQDYREAFIRCIDRQPIKVVYDYGERVESIDGMIDRAKKNFEAEVNYRFKERKEHLDGLKSKLAMYKEDLVRVNRNRDNCIKDATLHTDKDWYESEIVSVGKNISEIEDEIRLKSERHQVATANGWSAVKSNIVSIKTDAVFERKGVDVTLKFWVRLEPLELDPADAKKLEYDFRSEIITIEVKPAVGDDYPAVLRQMLAGQTDYLFLQAYTGVGATLDQFRKTFEASGKRVVFRHEVDALLPSPVN